MSISGKFVVFISLLMAIACTTQAFEKIAHVTSTYGEVCYDSCGKHSGSYYYCHSRSGWDYCSPSLNVDHHGKACKSDHPCGKHGLKYRWCRSNADSGWGYCGDVERKLTRYTSRYKKLCLDDCAYYASKDYYYCITSSSAHWEYCSPVPNVSYKNKVCNADHPCGLHGEDYYWCRIGSSWDYCGLVKWDECDGKTRRKRSDPPVSKLNCIVDQGNNVEVNYVVLGGDHMSTGVSRSSIHDAEQVIGAYTDDLLWRGQGNLISINDWRLDMQGSFNRGNVRYNNLQLQLNENRRGANHRTTYAAVLVPVHGVTPGYTGPRRIRDALLTSFNLGMTVMIEVIKRQAGHRELRSLNTTMKPNFESFEEIFSRGNSTTLDV